MCVSTDRYTCIRVSQSLSHSAKCGLLATQIWSPAASWEGHERLLKECLQGALTAVVACKQYVPSGPPDVHHSRDCQPSQQAQLVVPRPGVGNHGLQEVGHSRNAGVPCKKGGCDPGKEI